MGPGGGGLGGFRAAVSLETGPLLQVALGRPRTELQLSLVLDANSMRVPRGHRVQLPE